jgi:hypothetical protein
LFCARNRSAIAAHFTVALSAVTGKFTPLDKKWDSLPEPKNLVFG